MAFNPEKREQKKEKDQKDKRDISLENIKDAIGGGNIKAVEFFLNNGIDIDAQDELGFSALHDASEQVFNRLHIVELLIMRGAKIDIRSNSGHTPLMRAASIGDAESADLLLKNKAEINAKNDDGNTALHKAVETGCGCFDVVKLLFKYKADYNIKNNEGKTALMAARNSFTNIQRFFEERVALDGP